MLVNKVHIGVPEQSCETRDDKEDCSYPIPEEDSNHIDVSMCKVNLALSHPHPKYIVLFPEKINTFIFLT